VNANYKKNNYEKVYHDCLINYGIKSQTVKLIEEMAELTKELCKMVNRRDFYLVNHLQIIEEFTDVEIMLTQFKYYMESKGLNNDLIEEKEKKLSLICSQLIKAENNKQKLQKMETIEVLNGKDPLFF
jgi:hypothetical protein